MERSRLRTSTGRLRAPWRLLVAIVCVLFASVVGSIVFLSIDGLFLSLSEPLLTIGIGTASGVAVAVGLVVAIRTLDRRRIRSFGLALDGAWWRDLGVGLALGGGLIAVAVLVGTAIGAYRLRFAPSAPDGLTLLFGFSAVAVFVCVVGFYEELLFRGYVLTNTVEGLSAYANGRWAVLGAVGLSSLGFGVVHGLNPEMNLLGLGTITVAGVALGVGYVATGRLGFPIGFHITWNAAHFVFGLPVSGLDLGIRLFEAERVGSALVHGGAVGPEGGVLGFAVALLGCFLTVGYVGLIGGGLRSEVATGPSIDRSQ